MLAAVSARRNRFAGRRSAPYTLGPRSAIRLRGEFTQPENARRSLDNSLSAGALKLNSRSGRRAERTYREELRAGTPMTRVDCARDAAVICNTTATVRKLKQVCAYQREGSRPCCINGL